MVVLDGGEVREAMREASSRCRALVLTREHAASMGLKELKEWFKLYDGPANPHFDAEQLFGIGHARARVRRGDENPRV